MIYQGDCLAVLQTLPEASVNCCVTSPPYFGLRDYGVEGQIGLEASPLDFIAALVAVFREVRRVLTDDGVLWLNLGDSYAGSWGAQGRPNGESGEMADRSVVHARQIASHPRFEGLTGTRGREMGLKPKDLMMIPARAALALQADGWYLRADVIWHKPNPMPESVTDRPTKAHEYLFLLTKSARYRYDAAAIAEPLSEVSMARYERVGRNEEVYDPAKHKHGESLMHNAPMEVLTRAAAKVVERGTRNKRSVWTIPTQPFPEAHFATFPEALVEPCIRAGCPDDGVVLDPFCGAGTTGVVAAKLNRKFIGIELNPEYIAIAEKRIFEAAPLFAAAQEIA